MDLRQRGGKTDILAPESPSVAGAARRAIRAVDAFPKLTEEAAMRTKEGGFLTLIAICAIIVLGASETFRYIWPNSIESLSVDDSDPSPLHISIDITVKGSRCEFVELHTVDQAERVEHDFSRHVAKFAIDATTGAKLNPEAGNSKQIFPGYNFRPYCGSCHGTGEAFALAHMFFGGGACCNTCAEIEAKSPEAAQGSPQCKRERIRRDPRVPQDCRVIGTIPVPKLDGNFHIGAPNTTHVIHALGFGQSDPRLGGRTSGALFEHAEEVAEAHSGVFRYFLKVVPMLDAARPGVKDYRYSTTMLRDVRPSVTTTGGLFVGRRSTIFFVYKFSPYVVEVSYDSRGFLHFVTELCAVIGGAFAFARFFDTIIFYSRRQVSSPGGI